MLQPIIQARRDAQANDPNQKKPDDSTIRALTSFPSPPLPSRTMLTKSPFPLVLGWLMNRSDKEGHKKDSLFAKQQLTLIFVAVHTTSTTVTNM